MVTEVQLQKSKVSKTFMSGPRIMDFVVAMLSVW